MTAGADSRSSCVSKRGTTLSVLAELAGLKVQMVEGEEKNIKVTRKEDFALAERLMGGGDVRTATGYDVHKFKEGDHITILRTITEIVTDRGFEHLAYKIIHITKSRDNFRCFRSRYVNDL